RRDPRPHAARAPRRRVSAPHRGLRVRAAQWQRRRARALRAVDHEAVRRPPGARARRRSRAAPTAARLDATEARPALNAATWRRVVSRPRAPAHAAPSARPSARARRRGRRVGRAHALRLAAAAQPEQPEAAELAEETPQPGVVAVTGLRRRLR